MKGEAVLRWFLTRPITAQYANQILKNHDVYKMKYTAQAPQDPLIWELAQKYGGHLSQSQCYQGGSFGTN